ncbi:MAG: hypothetical protein OXG55_04345 [bacterium]|nr:hypothetical protein [bacterium]MCY4102486.1 hypothetical protein [bacterium]
MWKAIKKALKYPFERVEPRPEDYHAFVATTPISEIGPPPKGPGLGGARLDLPPPPPVDRETSSAPPAG